MSTRAKVITAVMLVILTICAIFLNLLARQNRQNMQSIISGKAESANTVGKAIIDQASRQYSLRIKSFINYKSTETRKELIIAFADRDREQLQRLSKPFFDLLTKENPYFASMGWILPDNTAFLRVHNPKNFGQDVTQMRPDVAAVNKDHRSRSGFTTGYVGLQYRVVQPVFYQGEYLGALQFGIDGKVLLDALSKQLKTPTGFAIPNNEYANILPQHKKGLAGPTHTIESTEPLLFKDLLSEIDWSKARQALNTKDKTSFLCNVNLLTNFQGKEVGTLFVALDISDEVKKVSLFFCLRYLSVPFWLVYLFSFFTSAMALWFKKLLISTYRWPAATANLKRGLQNGPRNSSPRLKREKSPKPNYRRPKKWKPSASWLVALPMTLTTSSPV